MPSSSTGDQRDKLRRQLRARRRALAPALRYAFSLRATAHLLNQPWYRHARRIALYWPVGSELDTRPLLAAALRGNKQIALPAILCRDGRLLFVRFHPTTRLRHFRHGIPQPRPVSTSSLVRTRALDLVLVPLLGFDVKGHRIGSGAGYYDRSFDFRKFSPRARPRLVGLGFDCQKLEHLDAGNWDVPLDAVVTESGWHYPISGT